MSTATATRPFETTVSVDRHAYGLSSDVVGVEFAGNHTILTYEVGGLDYVSRHEPGSPDALEVAAAFAERDPKGYAEQALSGRLTACFAAHDGFTVYGVGKTEAAAIKDAKLWVDPQDGVASLSTSPVDAAASAEFVRGGSVDRWTLTEGVIRLVP